MNVILNLSSHFVQIIAILGAVYILTTMFFNELWPEILTAQEQEAKDKLFLQKQNYELETKSSDNEKHLAETKSRISQIEEKVEKWITGVKETKEQEFQQQTAIKSTMLSRKTTISQNLQMFLKTKVVVDQLKQNVLQDLKTLLPASVAKEPDLAACNLEGNEFSPVTSSFGRSSFIYAKVFIGFLKNNNLPIPDPEFVMSLSQLFRSNDFFFFAKGGLFDPELKKTNGNVTKICVFSCKKAAQTEKEKDCCLCCYQWPEMLEKIKIDKYLQRFLEIIIAKDAQRIISDVLKELAFLIYADKGQILCEIESVKELSAEEVAEISQRITQLYKLTPVCVFKINPCLIGGVLIKSNLFRMDNSTYGYLNKVFYKLDAIKA